MQPWVRLPLVWFPDEDEEAIKARFCELMGDFYPQWNEYQIAEHLFKDLREPSRYLQVAQEWGKDLEIMERVKRIKLIKDGKIEKELTEEEWRSEILKVIRNTELSARDKKVTLDGLELYGRSKGWIIAPVDKADKGKNPALQLPLILMTERQENVANAA